MLTTLVISKTSWGKIISKSILTQHFGGQFGISLEGLMLKLKAPILWPPHSKSQLIGKDPDAGKDRRQEEKLLTEDEMGGWHHRLNGHEFEQTQEDSEGKESLLCCSSWGCMNCC